MLRSKIEPPKGLLEKILKRIRREERVLVLRRVILFSTTLAASLLGFVFTFKMVVANLAESGFLHFFSLMFSDFSVVTSYWQSFTLILLESLPAVSIALLLSILLVFLQSIKSLTKNIKIMLNRNRLAIN